MLLQRIVSHIQLATVIFFLSFFLPYYISVTTSMWSVPLSIVKVWLITVDQQIIQNPSFPF